MDLKNIFFLLFAFAFCANSFAQPIREVRYSVKVETADEAFASGDYYNAVEWYKDAYGESRDKDLAIKAAKSYMMLRDYKRAKSYYKRVLDRDKTNEYAAEKFNYAMALKSMGEYNDAYKVFNEFINESDDEEKRAEAMLQVFGIEKSSEFEDNLDANIVLASKKINSPSSESGPILVGEEIYYSSLNRKEVIIEGENTDEEEYFKIYTSKQDDRGYKAGTPLSDEVNREGYHTSYPSISMDGSRLYYVRTLIDEGEVLESKIYVSKKNGESWGAGQEVEGINGDYMLKHPAVGELYGNQVLFFVSDMEGGFGGTDLYYAESKGGNTYGTPVNLGESINSKYDEITPYYLDGTLYYSSDGRPGLGGFDIYHTSWDGSSWSEVVNLGNGYNSSADDFSYSINSKGTKGFLVSNRAAEGKRTLFSKTCCDDIFEINIKEIVIDLLAKVDGEEGPLQGAEVTLFDLSVGDDKSEPQRKSNMSSNDFSFGLTEDKTYKVLVRKEGYFSDSLEFNTVGILDDYTVERLITLKPVPPPPPVKEDVVVVTINQPIRMSNIYYDFDDDKILPSAEGDLTVIYDLMNKYSDMVIELSSHTDSQGTSTYNKQLSQRRANSAKNWLLAKGIAPERIQAVGYGEEVILNGCVNGKRCSDEEHALNRRTEFKIIAGPTSIEIKKTVGEPDGGNTGGMPFGYFQGEKPNTTIEFKKNNLQLGDVKIGELLEMEFVFTNTGKNELEIRTVTACHCTSFEYPSEKILPGESGIIVASYDPSKKKNGVGTYREAINIICNTENVVEEAIFHVNVVE